MRWENETLKAEKWIMEHKLWSESKKVKDLEASREQHWEPEQDFNEALMHMIINSNVIKNEMDKA